MYYINLIILAALLSSCASSPDTDNQTLSDSNPLEQSDSEISRYKEALTFLNSGKYDAAKEIFLELKSERPELAGPDANLAVIALKNNSPDKALELVKLALIKNPNLAQALNLLAYLEQLNGEIHLAEKHYKEAIKNKDDYAIAHYNIALLYDVYLQDIASAIPHYERYMTLTNNKDKATADWLEQLKNNKDKG
ncbi:MAG: tetratricopeptide repeat protein [Gammaproteobacteria bacterium]|nr:tetratricopeptide repeat protein [Gammaproteobacteria bacterium]